MKKFVMLFLLVTASAGVFAPQLAAQFHWSLTSRFTTQLFSRQTPLGEREENTITVGTQTLYNSSMTNNPATSTYLVPYGMTRGDYSYFSDTRNFFNYGRGG